MAEIRPMGLLAVWLHVPPEREDEFNAWYNTEHIAQITSIPGFLNGRRYMALEGIPKYLALYEMQDETVAAGREFQQVLTHPTPWSARMRAFYAPYRSLQTCRLIFATGEPPARDASYLYIVKMDIAAEFEQEFNEWYSQEHVPGLASTPGCLRARRFRAVEGKPKYMAVYELENPGVPSSAAWAKARDTAWTERIRPHIQHLERRFYQLILPAK